ncbi:hypothetical protein HF086_016574 [Spodoptera exigua]|uniref:F-box domain-containing protein n=1 Tax=Spodoptera exigua TaxID=7107 RepID=A0A922SC87_SPOEX|nr:hypothetical protein HF086_016574 [Spodoptera exigua]
MTTDNILQLPIDILVNIFKLLNIKDLHNVMLTCKLLKDLIKNDNTIWRHLSRDKLIIGYSDKRRPNDLWYNRCRTSQNWCNGYYRIKLVIKHYTNYMPWLTFHNSEILLVSVGSELQCYPTNRKGTPNCREALWKVEVPKIPRHDVRTNDISRFIIKNDIIACGNRDGCLAVYKLNNTRKRPCLQYHVQDCHKKGAVEVSAVEAIDGRNQTIVVTGSSNSSDLQFYGLKKESDNITHICKGNDKNLFNISLYETAGTKCMALNSTSDKLAIGLTGNSRPILLDVNNPRVLMAADATKNRKEAVRDIQWHNDNTLLYVTHAGNLHLLDIRSHELVYHTWDPFRAAFYCVKSDGQCAVVAGSAEYSRCVLFDTRKQIHHTQMFFTQKKASPVYSLDFDPYQLITAIDRGVSVLDFNINTSLEEPKDYSQVFH